MSYQLKKVRLLSYKLHAAFSPSAHFRPKKAPRAIFSRGGGRVYFGVNGQFLCLGGPSYGHWKTMRVVLKNFFDLTPLSPYPTLNSSEKGFMQPPSLSKYLLFFSDNKHAQISEKIQFTHLSIIRFASIYLSNDWTWQRWEGSGQGRCQEAQEGVEG